MFSAGKDGETIKGKKCSKIQTKQHNWKHSVGMFWVSYVFQQNKHGNILIVDMQMSLAFCFPYQDHNSWWSAEYYHISIICLALTVLKHIFRNNSFGNFFKKSLGYYPSGFCIWYYCNSSVSYLKEVPKVKVNLLLGLMLSQDCVCLAN